MLRQRTLKSMTRAVGVGLHSGQRVEMTLRPAPPDTGVVFRRVDLPLPVEIAVSAAAVSDARMASTISAGGDPGAPKVQTIEHLMSACSGLGIDNLVIDITADEVPILDGSAASFVFLLQSAGVALQDAPKRFCRILRPVEVREGEGAALKWARLDPFEGYKLAFEIEFDHPAVDQTGQRFEQPPQHPPARPARAAAVPPTIPPPLQHLDEAHQRQRADQNPKHVVLHVVRAPGWRPSREQKVGSDCEETAPADVKKRKARWRPRRARK